MIDPIASERVRNFGIPECLRVPIAAIDEAAIETYVGTIVRTLSGNRHRTAFLVKAHEPLPRDERLPLWGHSGAAMLHQPLQVWVHRTYSRYRAAYRLAHPHEDLGAVVLSHAMNRRLATIKGFQFIRLTPASRGANSSSAFSEGWAIDRYKALNHRGAVPDAGMSVQYADLTDIMLLLDLKLGGGVMDAVNEAQHLIRPTT